MCLKRNDNTKEIRSKISQITEKERYKIEGYKAIKLSNRSIAKILNKSHTAINNEIKRGTVKQLTSELIEIRTGVQ